MQWPNQRLHPLRPTSSMALSLHSPSLLLTPIQPSKPSSLTLFNCQYSPLTKPPNHITYNDAAVLSNPSPSKKWRVGVSFFPAFLKKRKDAKALKEELLDAIAPLDRGADATLEDQQRVDQVGISFLFFSFFTLLFSVWLMFCK